MKKKETTRQRYAITAGDRYVAEISLYSICGTEAEWRDTTNVEKAVRFRNRELAYILCDAINSSETKRQYVVEALAAEAERNTYYIVMGDYTLLEDWFVDPETGNLTAKTTYYPEHARKFDAKSKAADLIAEMRNEGVTLRPILATGECMEEMQREHVLRLITNPR